MSDRAKDAEILALRHQLNVLQRQLHGQKIRFTPADRALLAALLHRLPRQVLRHTRLLVRPETIPSLAPRPTRRTSCAHIAPEPGRPATHGALRPHAGAAPGPRKWWPACWGPAAACPPYRRRGTSRCGPCASPERCLRTRPVPLGLSRTGRTHRREAGRRAPSRARIPRCRSRRTTSRTRLERHPADRRYDDLRLPRLLDRPQHRARGELRARLRSGRIRTNPAGDVHPMRRCRGNRTAAWWSDRIRPGPWPACSPRPQRCGEWAVGGASAAAQMVQT
jgi:hypothetical protein